jgi:hypothetical protein
MFYIRRAKYNTDKQQACTSIVAIVISLKQGKLLLKLSADTDVTSYSKEENKKGRVIFQRSFLSYTICIRFCVLNVTV